jgi:hypothetical protein
MNKSVQHRRKLNTEQLIVLELLYKFRFGSNDLIAQYFGKKDRSFVFRRLSILLEQGLIGKRFEPGYRLRGKPAAYYLLPEGARTIQKYRDEGDTDEVNIKGIYKDATVSERFVDHCFAIFALYNQLMAPYEDELDFLSKSDQASFDNFPKPLPDAYLTFQTRKGGTKHFFLDVLDDDTHLLIDASKRIKRYIVYKKSGNWALVSGPPFPTIIFVCNSEEASKRVQKRCEAVLHRAWVLDAKFIATTSDGVRLDS